MKTCFVSFFSRAILPCATMAALLLGLGNCSQEGGYNLKLIGSKPSNPRVMVQKYLEQDVFGKGNIRVLAVAEPHLGVVGLDQGWLVCYKVNGKRPTGEPTGLQTRAILVRQGKIFSTVDRPYRSSNCGKDYTSVIKGKEK